MASAIRDGERFYLTAMGDFPDTFIKFIGFSYHPTLSRGIRTKIVYVSANGSHDALFTTQRVWVEFDDS